MPPEPVPREQGEPDDPGAPVAAPEGQPQPTAAEYLAAWGYLGLAGVGIYLAASYGEAVQAWASAPWAAAGLTALGLVLGAALGARLRPRAWASVAIRLVGAAAIGAAAFVAAVSLPGMLALVGVVGFCAGPEAARIVTAHVLSRARGEPYLYPSGLPLGRLVAALGGALLVLGATRHLTVVKTAFLGGLLANLWTLSSVPAAPAPRWGARLAMALAAAPALALAALVGKPGPWILAGVAVPALAARVRLVGLAPAAAALVFGVLLLRPGLAVSSDAVAEGFVVLRASKVALTADARDEALAGLHRDTRGIKVVSAGMTFFTDHDDVRRTEALVHPALALAPRRARVLVFGGDCTGITRELGRYPDLAVVDILRLNPGVEEFCRSVPAVSSLLGAVPPGRRFRIFDSDRPEPWAKALQREKLPYDVVFLFPPHPTFLPPDQIADLVRMIGPRGIIAIYLGSNNERQEAACVLHHLRGHLPHVIPFVVDPIREITGDPGFFALASPRSLDLSSLRFRVRTRVISPAVFRAMTRFPLTPKWLEVKKGQCQSKKGAAG